jgi:hypothetical protein
MKYTSKLYPFFLALLLIFVTGCSFAATEAPAEAEQGADVALKFTGSVNDRAAWSEEEIRRMETAQVTSTNKEGESETYTGVQIKSLLSIAGVKPDASKVIFIAGDGETAEVALSDVADCEDCIFTFRKNGGFSVLVPGVSKKLLVRGVVEVQVE